MSKKKKIQTEEMPQVEEKIIEVEVDESPRFTLDQLVNSDRYKKYEYLLNVYLKANETYTLKDVDKLISELTKR